MDAYQFACFYADCSKRYNTKFNLMRHISTTHFNIRNFLCPYCTNPIKLQDVSSLRETLPTS